MLRSLLLPTNFVDRCESRTPFIGRYHTLARFRFCCGLSSTIRPLSSSLTDVTLVVRSVRTKTRREKEKGFRWFASSWHQQHAFSWLAPQNSSVNREDTINLSPMGLWFREIIGVSLSSILLCDIIFLSISYCTEEIIFCPCDTLLST
mgnify:CR=1 FL=1